MIITTAYTIPGKRVVRLVGLAKGNTVRASHIGRDITAMFKNITGGEIREYTKLMAEAREQCLDRLRENAVQMGANAIIGMRFITSEVMQNAAELLAYGTAVVVEDD